MQQQQQRGNESDEGWINASENPSEASDELAIKCAAVLDDERAQVNLIFGGSQAMFDCLLVLSSALPPSLLLFCYLRSVLDYPQR